MQSSFTMASIKRVFIQLFSYKKSLFCMIFVVAIMFIIESFFYVYTDADGSLLETIEEQYVKFEGKLGTDEILPDVPQKTPEYDENWMDSYSEDNFYYDEVDHNLQHLKKPAAYAAKHRLPIIIWWTHFTGGNNIKRCSKGDCYFTEARKFKTHPRTKAFLFYGTSFRAHDLPLPRLAHHEWGLCHEESPKNNPILHHQSSIELFNHTSTFRRHSDYPLVTQFLNSIETLLTPPQVDLNQKKKNGLASIVYIQTGCNPPSDRDVYVEQLMKYIKIDSYGKCLHNKDLPAKYVDPLTMDDKGFHDILAQYKFTLSMENGICEDYITEKLWRPLTLGSVPIYRGSPSVNDWMPNSKSIILIDDFKSPKELADYIHWLNNNDDEYLKYLRYKTEGVTNENLSNFMKGRPWGHTLREQTFVSGFECLVCDRIHDNMKLEANGQPKKTHVASQDHYGCPRPGLFNFSDSKLAGKSFERRIWLDEYDQSKIESERLKKKVLDSTPKPLKIS